MLSAPRTPLITLLLAVLVPLVAGPAAAFEDPESEVVGPQPVPSAEADRPALELPPSPARLRVRRGWVSLVAGTRPERVGAHNRARFLAGSAFLSLASDSVAELRWAGRGSLRITGPAEIEWDAPRRAGDRLRVRFLSWRSIEAESRRGSGLEVVLQSEGWSVSGAAGAWQLTRGLGGKSLLRHHGGLPIRVEALVPGKGRGAPRQVESGGRLLLPAPPPAAIHQQEQAGRAAAEARQALRGQKVPRRPEIEAGG